MSSVYKLSVSLLSKLGFYEFRHSLYSKIILRLVALLRPRLGRVLALILGVQMVPLLNNYQESAMRL